MPLKYDTCIYRTVFWSIIGSAADSDLDLTEVKGQPITERSGSLVVLRLGLAHVPLPRAEDATQSESACR